MPLSYKNNAKDVIINKLRDVRYANNEFLFGFNNNIDISFSLKINVNQIALQADVFAREILTHRSKFDMKRFLGQYQDDWLRILHEAYVYDRIKAIYYGINSDKILNVPQNLVSFPGHVLLFRLLSKRQFSFSSNDALPYSIYVKLDFDVKDIFKEIFETYPDIKQGMSDNDAIVSYVNSQCESVLKGLQSAKTYLESSKNGTLFDISMLDSPNIDAFTTEMNNPILNSFLNTEGDRFYFIHPVSVSGPGKMRFNESLYISRALGFCGRQLEIDENNFYNVAKRIAEDPHTREEVYAVTGVRSEIIPYSSDQIKHYLGINSYKSTTNGGSNSTTTP